MTLTQRPTDTRPEDGAATNGARRRRRQRPRLARIDRRRWIQAGVAVLAALALLAGASWLVWGSPWLRVQQVQVVGASAGLKQPVSTAAAGALGVPLASVDTATIAAEVSQLVEVRSARVSRSWPATLVVAIEERLPVGFVGTGGDQFDVLGSDAQAMASIADKPDNVPELLGSREELPKLTEALANISPEVLAVVQWAAIKDDVVELTLRDDGGVVRWGAPESNDIKARTLSVLLLSVPESGWYDLSAPGAPVTAAERPGRLADQALGGPVTPTPTPSAEAEQQVGAVTDETRAGESEDPAGTGVEPLVEPQPGSGGEQPAQLTAPQQ